MACFLADCLRWLTLVLLAWPVLVGPWLFGSWEMWWFWTGVVFICLALIFTGLASLLDNLAPSGDAEDPAENESSRRIPGTRLAVLWGTLLPFLIYAVARYKTTEVAMDAERSFVLFLTPLLVAIPIVFTLRPVQRRVLTIGLTLNFCLLGLYGILNQLCPPLDGINFGGGLYVMGKPGYAQYTDEHRASGSYYCPDHYAGFLEIGIGLALGFLLSREVSWKIRLLSLIPIAIGSVGVVLSKSRGAGLTLIVLFAWMLCVGFSQWPPKVRWYLRAAAGMIGAIVCMSFVVTNTAYISRFFQGSEAHRYANTTLEQKVELVKEKIRVSSRGRMYAGALRAWREDRQSFWVGIGAGMHQNLWPHFAASSDGNRELYQWPSLTNHDFHSYEVHSDWLQLAEEYGLSGLLLFLIFCLGIVLLLQEARRNDIRRRRQERWHKLGRPGVYPVALGAQFAILAMAFHSLGDFNLQMPATVWVLAAVIALALADTLRASRMTRS